MLADLQDRLTDWRSLLDDHTPKARGLLKQLIVGRLDLRPDLREQLYRFEGRGTLLPLLAGIMPTYHSEWRPQRDSKVCGRSRFPARCTGVERPESHTRTAQNRSRGHRTGHAQSLKVSGEPCTL